MAVLNEKLRAAEERADLAEKHAQALAGERVAELSSVAAVNDNVRRYFAALRAQLFETYAAAEAHRAHTAEHLLALERDLQYRTSAVRQLRQMVAAKANE